MKDKKELAIKMAAEAIKYFEGFSGIPYTCFAGKRTIGYGHVIQPGEDLKRITKEQAEELLLSELSVLYKEIKDNIRPEVWDNFLKENQIAALLSFVYNVGITAFKKSTMLKKINTCGNMKLVADEFPKWVWSNGVKLMGLIERRRAEKELFLTGL